MNNDKDNNIDIVEDFFTKREKAASKALKEISPEIFSAFLMEKGASQQCLSCGSSSLVVPASTDVVTSQPLSDSYQAPDHKTSEINDSSFIDYVSYTKIDHEIRLILTNVQYTVQCKNCGYMSYYKAAPVVNWHSNKKSTLGDQG